MSGHVGMSWSRVSFPGFRGANTIAQQRENVQNMLVMRFENTFLSAMWSQEHISNIQIVMKEAFGTEGRGGYFDKFGIIRDVIQNHLLQVALYSLQPSFLLLTRCRRIAIQLQTHSSSASRDL